MVANGGCVSNSDCFQSLPVALMKGIWRNILDILEYKDFDTGCIGAQFFHIGKRSILIQRLYVIDGQGGGIPVPVDFFLGFLFDRLDFSETTFI